LFVSYGPTVAQSVAVFDFELIDTSLEGAILVLGLTNGSGLPV